MGDGIQAICQKTQELQADGARGGGAGGLPGWRSSTRTGASGVAIYGQNSAKKQGGNHEGKKEKSKSTRFLQKEEKRSIPNTSQLAYLNMQRRKIRCQQTLFVRVLKMGAGRNHTRRVKKRGRPVLSPRRP